MHEESRPGRAGLGQIPVLTFKDTKAIQLRAFWGDSEGPPPSLVLGLAKDTQDRLGESPLSGKHSTGWSAGPRIVCYRRNAAAVQTSSQRGAAIALALRQSQSWGGKQVASVGTDLKPQRCKQKQGKQRVHGLT